VNWDGSMRTCSGMLAGTTSPVLAIRQAHKRYGVRVDEWNRLPEAESEAQHPSNWFHAWILSSQTPG